MKIEFLKSPCGSYNLAYSVGDQADFEDKQANELIENGFAKEVKPTDTELAAKEKPEKEETDAKAESEKETADKPAKDKVEKADKK